MTFTTDRGWDSYQDVGSAINWTGFTEKDSLDTEVFTFVPAVQFIRLPWTAQSWSGMTEAQSSGGGFDVDWTIDVTGPEEVQARDTSGPIDDGRIWWIGCWKLVLGFELSIGGVTQQFGSQTFWFAPTIGIVQEVDDEQQDDGGSEESESYLQLPEN